MENTESHGMIEVDLKRLLGIIWKRVWLILAVGFITGALAVGYAWFFVTPTYGASVQLYVNNQVSGSPGFSSSQIVAAQDLADTYMVILRSRNVLDEVAEKTGLGYTYNQLRGMLDTGAINETEVFQVDVICTNYQHAAQIANAIADVLPDKIAAVVDGSSVRVVDRAVENPNRIGPSYSRHAVIGGVVGCTLTILLVLLAEFLDNTITSEDYLTQVYGELPLLAVIPGSEDPKNKYYKYRGYYKGNYETVQKKTPPQTADKTGGGKK